MKDQAITFAAICQIANFVQQISKKGVLSSEQDNDIFAVLLESIIKTSPENTLDVYGGQLTNIKQGLVLLIEHLGDKTSKYGNAKDPELTRYLINLINLERRLSKQPKQLANLGERIDATKRQVEHYSITSDTLIASFASIYSDIISPLGTPIQVTGEPSILKQTSNQHKIRALLLAGIRAAVLWRQVGGKRRNILFARKKLVNTAKTLLNTL